MPPQPSAVINRDSPLPLYYQLARMLTDDIARGRWAPGDRIASEPEIGALYGVSRATVRQALQRLEGDGLIQRIKGRGTFVADTRSPSWLLQSSSGFFHEEVDRMGFDVSSDITRAERAALPSWVCDAFGLPKESEGGILERVRRLDGRVALFVIDYVRAELASAALSLLHEDGSLYDRLQEREGLTVAGGQRTLESVRAEARLAELLEVKRREPILFIESVAWDADLRPFHCFQTWVRTDRIRIEMQVTRTPGSAVPLPRSSALGA
jgi:GntR family transcriptional regulator